MPKRLLLPHLRAKPAQIRAIVANMAVFGRFAASGALVGAVLWVSAHAASAQTVAPYDEKMGRLAEVLGSIHYLINLCTEPSNRWRQEMEELLAAEKPEPVRRAQLVAAFNKGYRSFDSVYTRCTDQARISADRYVAEGQALTVELTSTFGAQ